MKKIITAIGYDIDDILDNFVKQLDDMHIKYVPETTNSIKRIDRILYAISKTMNVINIIDKYRNRYIELMLLEDDDSCIDRSLVLQLANDIFD
jgi:hypothetical protein